MFSFIRSLLLTLSISCFSLSYANELPAPDVFMEQITADVLKDLQDLPQENRLEALDNLIKEKIVPYVDLPFMARWVAGRRAWSQADSQTQQQFTTQFESMLIRTYSSTLETFKNRKMTYSRNMKKDYHQEKTTQVYATVEDPGKNPIAVIYQMRRFDNEWKVFDVIVEGISMLKGLQAQYEQIIATEGLPGAINRMKEQL